MTFRLWRLSEQREPAARDRFLQQFRECAAGLRTGKWIRFAPSSAYTGAVVELALQRPSELFLALEGDVVVGRTLVSTSHAGPDVATLGLFEMAGSVAGSRAGHALVNAGVEWATAAAHRELFAPVDVVTWFNYRFFVPPSGDDAGVEPFAWEPVQPPDYLSLFQEGGFTEAERYLTMGATFGDAVDALEAVRMTAPANAKAAKAGYHFEQLGATGQLDALLGEIYVLCMDAFRDTFLFEPLPETIFRRVYMSAAASLDCSLTHVVRAADGRLAGFVFAFVDGDAVVIKTIAVAPNLRGQHLSTALTHLALRRAAERGLRSFISALVRRENTSEFLALPYIVPGLRLWRHEYVLLRRGLASA